MSEQSITPKGRILVINDEEDMRWILARMLTLDGYETQTASGADAALETIPEFHPDAIFVDLAMPYVNGLGFLYRLREADIQIRVTLITGQMNIGQETLEEIALLGATLRFKPLSLEDLLTAASRIIADRSEIEKT